VNRAPSACTLALALAACQPPSTSSSAPRPAAPAEQYHLLDLVGSWRWLHKADEAGTSRVEDEQWTLVPDTASPTRLVGTYLRSVEVRSTDGVPFRCNQRPWYRQRAVYDVVVEVEGSSFTLTETAYQAEPSPCDHGFRHKSSYTVEPRGNRLVLRWDNGTQTLWHVDDAVGPLPEPPWHDAASEPTGPWRWQASSYDDDGNVRDEAEWWEITRRTDTRVDATYRRRVTVRDPSGATIACASAPTWSFDDAYVLSGQREEEHWHFYELAVEPGDHPCLRTTPRRTIDEATAEQIGDFLVLEWRGKRRQVLYRP
jgi:hypothetical protein